MGEDETKKEGNVGPGQRVRTEEFLKLLREFPPDPTLMDDVREMGGSLEDLGDPWEEARRRRTS